jgi:hypothetical protein
MVGTSSAAMCAQQRTTLTAWARTSRTSPPATTGHARTTAVQRVAGALRLQEGCCSGGAAGAAAVCKVLF